MPALWEASNVAANNSIVINLQDRMELVSGLSRMIASLPMDQQPRAFETLMAQTLGRLDSASQQSRVAQSRQVEEIVATQVGDEIRILATMARGVTDSDSSDSNAMESDCNTPDGVVAIPQPFLETIHKGWASINHAAACLSWNEVCRTRRFALLCILISVYSQILCFHRVFAKHWRLFWPTCYLQQETMRIGIFSSKSAYWHRRHLVHPMEGKNILVWLLIFSAISYGSTGRVLNGQWLPVSVETQLLNRTKSSAKCLRTKFLSRLPRFKIFSGMLGRAPVNRETARMLVRAFHRLLGSTLQNPTRRWAVC